MKILHCLSCRDMVALRLDYRTCACGKSSGQYAHDGLHAVYEGPARILGMLNPDVKHSELHPPTEPFVQNFKWFVIGHWPGCHIHKFDAPELYNESPMYDRHEWYG